MSTLPSHISPTLAPQTLPSSGHLGDLSLNAGSTSSPANKDAVREDASQSNTVEHPSGDVTPALPTRYSPHPSLRPLHRVAH
ncbi:hypothetical protein PHISCL_08427 [Aspergillus sclerotialis]|uniref:Uncharacterized protein n=1 Tax=Aspergillus sclerotialis TaxID=2070753 RepID=A0A3A2Z817_9EURO|nr:hypothetical protein PHISCL_08427 [Aspergillus sclerotialis]